MTIFLSIFFFCENPKETNRSGDPVKDDIPIKVLGLIWDTERDTFQIDIKVNFSGKRAGARLGPDLDLDG